MTLGVPRSPASVASVAGIVGALKGCLDLLSDISCLESLKQEWPILQAKLDVERTLLLQWADKVKLLEEVHDTRLNDSATHHRVLQLLCDAQALLQDKPQLESSFQVLMYKQEDSSPDETYLSSSLILSKPRMEHFNAEIARRNIPVLRLQEDATSSSTVYRRVATDPECFERFVETVGRLVNALNRLASRPNCLGCAAEMAREDVRRCKTIEELRLVRDATKGLRDTVAHSAEDLVVRHARDRVLKNLWFRGMHERRTTLKDPHPGTFEWALKPPQIDTEWDDLGQWLESGSDIYWVSGKQGAGKSTFLKHLYDHPETRRRLDAWGGDETVSMGSYFFWSMGNGLQKCRDGMARAMLYHILSEIPSIIPDLLPNMWNHAYEGGVLRPDEMLPLPSIPEVRMAFEKMAEDGILDRRFCFFVDGLDEYAGDDARAVNFIQKLNLSAKIKIVVSSTPTPVFVESFANVPKLHLHDLTKGDILQYMHDKLDAHPYMEVLYEMDQGTATILIETLAERADGVFLRAMLGIKAFLRGLDAYEEMIELELRIKDIPKELEEMYEHAILMSDSRYREEAIKMIRICYRSKLLRAMSPERGRLWTVGLASIEAHGQGFDNVERHEEVTLQARHRQCLTLENRIDSRCGGLLEVVGASLEDTDNCFCATPEPHPDHDILINSSIEFVHETVFEWFGKLTPWTIAHLGLRDNDFSADEALASISLQQCRVAHELGAPFPRADTDMANCMLYLQHTDNIRPEFAHRMLQRIHELVAKTRQNRGSNWHFSFCCTVDNPLTEHLGTLYFAVAMGMVNFVRYYTEQRPDGPTLQALEEQYSMEWWRIAADRNQITHFLAPYHETIRRLPPQGPMLQYLAEIGCAVPSAELQYYAKTESLNNRGSFGLSETHM